MSVPLYRIDAFADRPFAGNPAAVCLLDGPRSEAWMQAVAAEMNCSETAFVQPGDGDWGLRWFSPATEVALCGHATLAAAVALWHAGRLAPDAEACFATRSGRLSCVARDGWVAMDFPACASAPANPPPELFEALGAMPVSVARIGEDWLVEVDAAATVRGLAPDLAALRAMPGTRGVAVTAAGDLPGIDFVSRFFAPAVGIDEDPVTGSAHCALGPWWGRRLRRQQLVAHQVSRRGGAVRMTLQGARVTLAGQGQVVAVGTLLA